MRGFEFCYENDDRMEKNYLYEKIEFTRIRKIKKSRINTTCEFCNNSITIGSSCEYWSGISQGRFFYYRVCESCLTMWGGITVELKLTPKFENADMESWKLAIEVVEAFVNVGFSESLTYDEVYKEYQEIMYNSQLMNEQI
jgi:hypothetical protein